LHAFAFNPIPANFTDPGTIAQLQETFIFWRVSKGGIGLPNEGFPWASVMPPWEQHLTTDEIWKVICSNTGTQAIIRELGLIHTSFGEGV